MDYGLAIRAGFAASAPQLETVLAGDPSLCSCVVPRFSALPICLQSGKRVCSMPQGMCVCGRCRASAGGLCGPTKSIIVGVGQDLALGHPPAGLPHPPAAPKGTCLLATLVVWSQTAARFCEAAYCRCLTHCLSKVTDQIASLTDQRLDYLHPSLESLTELAHFAWPQSCSAALVSTVHAQRQLLQHAVWCLRQRHLCPAGAALCWA